MDYQSLYLKTVVELRKSAKEMGVRIPAGASKAIIINLLLEAWQKESTGTKDNETRNNETKKVEDTVAECSSDESVMVLNTEDACAYDGAKEDDDEADKHPRMRMASNPQVVNRRLPVRKNRGTDDSIADCNGAVVSLHDTPRPEYRQISSESSRLLQRSDGKSGRYDRRTDLEQNRYAGYAPDQNRYGRRGEIAAQQNRYNIRQDVYGNRTRDRAENRNSYCRQVIPEGRKQFRDASFDRNGIGNSSDSCAGYPATIENSMTGNPVNADEYTGVHAEGLRNNCEGYSNEECHVFNPAVQGISATGECAEGSGVLEIQPDGYGFLRAENYSHGSRDVYVSIAQIRRFNLRMGDRVVGQIRPQREGDRYTAMMYITEVNGQPPENMIGRRRFDELMPVYPNERLRLEQPEENDPSLRMIDMLAPIGKGQRGLIVSPPKAGKTTLLKKLANAIAQSHPEVHLIVLLIDERPEEVTDMKRSIKGEVVYSTFDETPENHVQVSEMVLERAQRLVELGKDVVILMDSITRLARAYNLVIPPTGRSLSGGFDPGALHKPKRFFGAARNIENGGSLTVIATALIDTGSRMDDIIYEEFKGTGNMELHLDRKLSDRRVFPAMDMVHSGTRREEILLTEAELEGMCKVRRMLAAGNDQGDAEKIISLIEKTSNNAEFFQRLNAYQNVYEKSGFSMGKDSVAR